jgi:hypothetical protein
MPYLAADSIRPKFTVEKASCPDKNALTGSGVLTSGLLQLGNPAPGPVSRHSS